MGAFLVVSNEALVHSFVVLLDALDPENGFFVAQGLAVLQPGDGLDGVALGVAGKGGWPTEVNGLTPGFNLGRERRRDCQDCLDALTANRVVDDAEVLARVLDLGLENNQGAADLANPVV